MMAAALRNVVVVNVVYVDETIYSVCILKEWRGFSDGVVTVYRRKAHRMGHDRYVLSQQVIGGADWHGWQPLPALYEKRYADAWLTGSF